ncbi:MAG: AAA family ATPase [Gammaproteobacteria bacterium]|nr:AAA family ATPase [Gammaproteobacteria bacterium]
MPGIRHLDGLSVRGFKALADVELHPLGAFNVFLGANDVGKTSVLEAVFLLTGISNLQLPISVQNHRKYLVQSFDDLSYFFHDLNVDAPIELVGQVDGGETRRLSITAPSAYAGVASAVQRIADKGDSIGSKNTGGQSATPRPTSSSSFGARVLHYEATITTPGRKKKAKFAGQLKVGSSDDVEITVPSPKHQQWIVPAVIFHPGADYTGRAIADVLVHKMEAELLEMLRHINRRIRRIAMRGDVAYLDVGLEQMVPLNMFGSGMVRAAQVLSHCLLGRSRVLLIDEIENGLHHEGMVPFLKGLLTVAVRRNVQVFATAHSLELLKGLQQVLGLDECDDVRSDSMCYVLARNKDDAVVAYGYDFPKFDHCLERGIEIR